MSRPQLFAFCGVALLIAFSQLAPPPAVGVATQKLTVREETDRVVLAWSGPVEKPMPDEIATAVERYKADPAASCCPSTLPAARLLGAGR